MSEPRKLSTLAASSAVLSHSAPSTSGSVSLCTRSSIFVLPDLNSPTRRTSPASMMTLRPSSSSAAASCVPVALVQLDRAPAVPDVALVAPQGPHGQAPRDAHLARRPEPLGASFTEPAPSAGGASAGIGSVVSPPMDSVKWPLRPSSSAPVVTVWTSVTPSLAESVTTCVSGVPGSEYHSTS